MILILLLIWSNLVFSKLAVNIPFSSFVKSNYVTNLANNTIKIKYVPVNRGSPIISGYKPLPNGFSQRITLEYDVKFDKNFEWVNGGKLPGISSLNKRAVGCIQPQPIDGWSYRLMWRSNGIIEMYLYDQSRIYSGVRCGATVGSKTNLLTKDKWINLKMYMKLNSNASASNGIAKLYVNNKLILSKTGIKFKGVNNANISNIVFNTFYGGNGPSWSPSKPTYAWIRGARIYNYNVLTKTKVIKK